MQIKLLKYSLLIFLSLVILAGCKSWKKTTSEPSDIEMEKLRNLSEKSVKANFRYDWLQAKISGKLETGNNNFRFKANLRMKKDSVIWVSVTPGFGFEVARLMITSDSVKMINRLKQTYFLEKYSAIKNLIGIDIPFSSFQEILIGNMPVIESFYNWQTDTIENLHVIKEKADYNSDQSYTKNVRQEYRVNPQNYKLSKIRVEQLKPQNRLISFSYSDYQERQNMMFPAIVKGLIDDGSISKIYLNYKKLDTSEKQHFPFSINPKYKKLNIKNLPR
ncbi:MAG: DUF4292 domain-containing protein [Bacteroidales bacterium]|nr:DUF4292 domain-containing protein [Bacteroidales bacterium]MCF8326661.1 DUF4292 domain-containing protein [Bacteroidales bacterium]